MIRIITNIDMNQELRKRALDATAIGQDPRLQQLVNWLQGPLSGQSPALAVASADASFRRYFRVRTNGESFIAMDAPPDKEDCKPFVDVTHRLRAAGVHAPRIVAQNPKDGFLLLEDLGDVTYLDVLSDSSVDALYQDAFEALFKIQQADSQNLPVYDRELLTEEMQRFEDWFLERHLGISLSPEQTEILDSTIDRLCTVILEQPRCLVHRDYHCRNLMQLSADNPGVIDYQDAVLGPVTYDLVSLLRDAYICWPRERVESWVCTFAQTAVTRGLWQSVDSEQVLKWFDLMGVQRHLKVLGIFARLYLRDGKSGYLKDMPRTFDYLHEVSGRHSETKALHQLLDELNIGTRLK